MVEADFISDWHEYLRTTMREAGVEVPDTLRGRDLEIAFFSGRHRGVEAKPRRVQVADGVVCPPAVEEGFKVFLEKVERGENLTPHLSTRALDLTEHDGLRNEWGVYHFHLGTKPHPERPGFVERTRELALVIFDGDKALVLGVHPHKPAPWTRFELMEILYAHWPEFMERYRLNGVTPSELTDDQRAVLRKKGLNACLSLGGFAFMGPGGAVTVTGVRASDVRDADYYNALIQRLEKAFKERIGGILEETDLALPVSMAATMKIEGGHVVVYVNTTPTLRLDMGKIEPAED